MTLSETMASAGAGKLPAPAQRPLTAARDAAPRDADAPALDDFLDIRRLLEMQERLAALTQMSVTLHDPRGKEFSPATLAPTALDQEDGSAVALSPELGQSATGRYVAPIMVEGQELGSIVIAPQPPADIAERRQALRQFAQDLEIPLDRAERLIDAAQLTFSPNPATAVELLYLWARGLTRACYQEYELRQRLEELETLFKLSTLLSTHRSLQQVLDAACRSAAQVLDVKAASIRLLDDSGKELLIKAVHNLSKAYLDKGPLPVDRAELYRRALAGEVIYVEDMTNDPRIVYPDDARREGLVSLLTAAMIYQNQPIGVIRLYSGVKRRFTGGERNLLRAIAQLLAAAIQGARLAAEREEAQRVQRQLHLAADVQKRMLPATPPHLPHFDIAARYVPSFELGGDFFDFISLDSHLGIAVGDVVGKGVPASLLMASVRASLRAYAQDVYDIDEVISRVNIALSRDTLDNEFATLFYGVLDPQSRRLTYCSAGHEPPLLLSNGQLRRLDAGGMIVGIDPHQHYEKGVVQLNRGDLLLIYTDGLTDALNFNNQKFGKERVVEAMRDAVQARMSAQDALNHILWQMRRFVGLNRSHDDTTLVVVKGT